ncbi:MAG TPA: YtxH domain-containing protein [Gemmatimonadota bacterium]|nr:YtxH domain-containing protein [Gemmatimonadota bacterium]
MIGKLKALGAGFLLGILVAPRSGAASRQLLKDRLAEFFASGQRNLEELEDDLAERRRTTAGLRESDWPEVDESMIGETETGSGA